MYRKVYRKSQKSTLTKMKSKSPDVSIHRKQSPYPVYTCTFVIMPPTLKKLGYIASGLSVCLFVHSFVCSSRFLVHSITLNQVC